MIIEQLNTLLTVMDKDSNEYIISAYLLNHWQYIINDKVSDILNQIGISKSTLSRFCKTLGYRHFTDVQYQLFFEMSKVHHYENHVELDNEIMNIKYLLIQKKRIIVIGDESSISPLLIYKQLFFHLGIDFILRLKNSKPIHVLEEFSVRQNDVVIYISLFKTNLELLVNIFEHYIELTDYLKKENIPYVYIGKTVDKKENEENIIEIKASENISEAIFQLCEVFEKIYALVKKEHDNDSKK